MRHLLFIGLIATSAGSSAFAQGPNPQTNLEEYWNRGFGVMQAVVNHSISFRTNDVDALAARIDSMMVSAGSASSLNNSHTYTNNMNGVMRRVRQSNYNLSTKACDLVVRRLLELEGMTSYSLNKPQMTDMLSQVEERIATLEKELATGRGVIEKMPSTRHFVDQRLKQLRQVRDSYRASAANSSVSVSIQESDGR